MYINTLKQELSTAKTYEHNRLDETSIVDRHRCHMAAKFGLFVDEDHSKLHTLYWLPKLHKRPYKSRFIANSSACTVKPAVAVTSIKRDPPLSGHFRVPPNDFECKCTSFKRAPVQRGQRSAKFAPKR